MNATIEPVRKFEEWPDENPWTPTMFASSFSEGIPVPDSQFWTTPGNNSEEYYRPNLHTTRGGLGHDMDASDNYNTGFTLDNVAPASGSFVYSQHAAAQSAGQPGHPYDSPYAGQRHHENEEEALYDGSVASSSVEASTAGYKRRYSSRSPEVTKFSPQSTTAVSPASGSSVNWIGDGAIVDPLSPPSPSSSINVRIADPSAGPANGGPSPPTKSRRNRERNRVAAHKCRQKAKQSMSELQTRERELSQQNRMLQEHAGSLRDEILDLKNEILRHSDCNSDVIQNYIAKAARDVN
ncbi:hypothetical protein F5Y13DRAFT_158251 [Hypoxylon sp. FL1857]|nr:hypothetical protein F5Y13DRAFT_158251 [Hypoxylon sp. FL1857]